MAPMLRVLVSLMGVQDNTSGVLLQDMKLVHFLIAMCMHKHKSSWQNQTTSSICGEWLLLWYDCYYSLYMQVYSTPMVSCGMALVVGLWTHAAPLTILHGSTSSSHNQQLMTLKWGYAWAMWPQLKTYWLKLLSFTYSRLLSRCTTLRAWHNNVKSLFSYNCKT
jgi:hypothetical protein